MIIKLRFTSWRPIGNFNDRVQSGRHGSKWIMSTTERAGFQGDVAERMVGKMPAARITCFAELEVNKVLNLRISLSRSHWVSLSAVPGACCTPIWELSNYKSTLILWQQFSNMFEKCHSSRRLPDRSGTRRWTAQTTGASVMGTSSNFSLNFFFFPISKVCLWLEKHS